MRNTNIDLSTTLMLDTRIVLDVFTDWTLDFTRVLT